MQNLSFFFLHKLNKLMSAKHTFKWHHIFTLVYLICHPNISPAVTIKGSIQPFRVTEIFNYTRHATFLNMINFFWLQIHVAHGESFSFCLHLFPPPQILPRNVKCVPYLACLFKRKEIESLSLKYYWMTSI